MKATRSCVPFRMSASRAVPVAKPSFLRAERIASITSSRELKIAARAGDVRGATAVLLSPLQANHAQREQATRGAYAARVEQGEELTRAATLRESRPCTRGAQPHCTLATCRRDAEAGAPLIVPLRRRVDSCTAANDGLRRGPLSRTNNMFYGSYVSYLCSHASCSREVRWEAFRAVVWGNIFLHERRRPMWPCS